MRIISIAVAAVTLMLASCVKPQQPADTEQVLAQGKQVYEQNCASCHGTAGDGQGSAAYLLFPKPRNFQKSEFKLRSTPQGMLPTHDDLMKTVSQGIPGTGMFAFNEVLTESERNAVVEYVKFLTPRFENAPSIRESDLLKISEAPERTPHLIDLGKATYDKFGCAKCHGPQGRGDGPSAPTLVDTSGDPFPAADFSRGIYKSGGRPEDLYRTFLTGMDGTPMPSFQEAFTNSEEAWALAYYTLSFSPSRKAAPTSGDAGPLYAVSLGDPGALTDPDSPDWSDIAPHRVYLRPLWYRNDYPLWVRVRAAVVGDRIDIMAEWDDATNDASADREQSFPDGVALQFALTGRMPFIAMGDRNAQGLVEIWHWRADRQLASNRGKTPARRDTYPNMPATQYPQPEYQTAQDAGNPIATNDLGNRPTHGLAASGFGTLTSRSAVAQTVEGRGRWKDGVYRVVFSTKLQRGDRSQADFTAPRVPLGFAIWDGHAGDRNGTKLVSQWLMLVPSETVLISQRRPQ